MTSNANKLVRGAGVMVGVVLLACATVPTSAQTPAPTQPEAARAAERSGDDGAAGRGAASQDRDRPLMRAMIERRTPEELREALARKQASLREQLAAVEQAQSLLQEGKPTTDAARVLIGTEHPIIFESLVEAARESRGPFGPGRFEGRPEGRGEGPADGPPGGPRGQGPRGEGARREGPRGEGPRERTPESERQAVLEVLRQELPAVFERYEALREREPAIAERIGERLLPRVREAMRVREGDAELYRLRIREVGSSFDVLGKIRAYRDAAKASPQAGEAGAANEALQTARTELRAAMQANFDDKLALANAEVARLDIRKREMQERAASAVERRTQLIDAAIAEIEAGRMPQPVFEPVLREGGREGPPPPRGP
jgi:hypothetical protein